MIFSVSSVSSDIGQATVMTSRVAVILDMKVPGRCTLALSLQKTEPQSQIIVGGALPGILKNIGKVYVPNKKNLLLGGKKNPHVANLS